jgi:hypothetical protein
MVRILLASLVLNIRDNRLPLWNVSIFISCALLSCCVSFHSCYNTFDIQFQHYFKLFSRCS